MISKMNILLLTLVSIFFILSIIVLMKDNKKENLDATNCVYGNNYRSSFLSTFSKYCEIDKNTTNISS